MSSDENISIVTVCDNHYCVMLAALLKSIEINHLSGEFIDFYIVTDGLNKDNEQKLSASINSPLIALKFLKIEDVIPANIHLPRDSSSFPLNVYARLFIPYFIQEHIKRVIYLDVDMIVLREISKLWKINLQKRLVAGVVDRAEVVSCFWGGIENYKELEIAPDTKYFNSGLMVIDTDLWRDYHIPERAVRCIANNLPYAKFPDQYGLNVVLANQWYQLDPKWNTYAVDFEKNPFIVHFIGRKPIYKSYSYNQLYEKEFYKYLKLTKWENFKPLSEYNRLFKKAYNKAEKIILKMKR
jgi:lipopolysaccharide biosynthesis glycosyltransferase